MSQLFLFSTVGFVWWLIRVDRSWRKSTAAALWIPGLWMAMLGSRPPAFWLSGMNSNSNSLEGSSINLVFIGGLIIGAILVLQHRKFDWGEFIQTNKWLVLVYAYHAVNALGSEFPVPSLKRLITNFGCVLVGLLILSERNPAAALRAVFVRVGYALIPISMVLIRYIPAVGRTNSVHGGEVMVTGVAEHKNSLGAIVMIVGLVILWDLMENWKNADGPKTKVQQCCHYGVFLAAFYLLIISRSATALACFILGTGCLLCYKRLAAFKNAKQLVVYGLAALCCFMLLDAAINVRGMVFRALGRNESLTGRTEIWDQVKSNDINELFGAGYRIFWESKSAKSIWEESGRNRLTSAHNGYLESYLDGGAIGLALLGIWILTAGWTSVVKLSNGDPIGKVAFAFWTITVISNNSESSFFMQTPLWFTVVLVTVNYRFGVLLHAPELKQTSILPAPVSQRIKSISP